MKVFWTEAAIADLMALRAYVGQRSPRYADGLIGRILRRSEQLQTHPLSGHVVPEYGAEHIRELIESPYRIIYQTSEARFDVLAVIHAARRLPSSSP